MPHKIISFIFILVFLSFKFLSKIILDFLFNWFVIKRKLSAVNNGDVGNRFAMMHMISAEVTN